MTGQDGGWTKYVGGEEELNNEMSPEAANAQEAIKITAAAPPVFKNT